MKTHLLTVCRTENKLTWSAYYSVFVCFEGLHTQFFQIMYCYLGRKMDQNSGLSIKRPLFRRKLANIEENSENITLT
jgi:hypothetical protein